MYTILNISHIIYICHYFHMQNIGNIKKETLINNVFNRIFIQNILSLMFVHALTSLIFQSYIFTIFSRKNILIMRHKLSLDSLLRFQGYVFMMYVRICSIKKTISLLLSWKPQLAIYMCNWVLIIIKYHCFFSLHFQMHACIMNTAHLYVGLLILWIMNS